MKKRIEIISLMVILVGMIFLQPTVQIMAVADSDVTLLSVGDSISTGYGLEKYNPKDLSQATESYINLLGNELNIKPMNLAIDGLTTAELSSLIKKSEVQEMIKTSDYITVNIGGNNLLRPMLEAMAKEYGMNFQTTSIEQLSKVIEADVNEDLQQAQAKITFGLLKALPEIEKSVSRFDSEFKEVIQQLNILAPNAKIMVSTIYNPFSHMQNSEFSAAVQRYTDKMNSSIIKTNKSEPYLNSYYIVDINEIFSISGTEGLVNADDKNGKMNLDPHPTAKGHKLIYQAYSNIFKGFRFVDIDQHYAKNSILYLISIGVLNGVDQNRFAPNDEITRAQFVKILYITREGTDISNTQSTNFSDVKESDWFKPYIDWAANNGIVLGNEQNQFLPNQQITRQDMCIMLNRFIQSNVDYSTTASELVFSDDSAISTYAKEAVYKMKALGLISGKANNQFDPLGKATRGEAAVIIERYINN